MKKIVCLLLCVMGMSNSANAALLSNFNAIYDSSLERIQYNFDLISVDASSPEGVNQLYINYDPGIAFFTPSTSIVSATSTNNTITLFTATDEFALRFDPLENEAVINYSIILDNVNTSVLETTANLRMQVFLNPFFIQGSHSLTGWSEYPFNPASDIHSEGSLLTSVPEPTPIALLTLGLAGMFFSRKKIK